jgi:hypothetical protein
MDTKENRKYKFTGETKVLSGNKAKEDTSNMLFWYSL